MNKIIKWPTSYPLTNDSESCNKELNEVYGNWEKSGENFISQIIAKSKINNILLLRFVI
tara:strand:+ start:279 stop:455 length:177 start_codon:yes stop_codon:yes gene_type:complete